MALSFLFTPIYFTMCEHILVEKVCFSRLYATISFFYNIWGFSIYFQRNFPYTFFAETYFGGYAKLISPREWYTI